MSSASTPAGVERRKRRSMLRQFYADEEEKKNANLSPAMDAEFCDPFDINSPDFNADLYFNKLLKEKSLSKLMEKEQQMYRQIQTLDSEMQTLVYENYNKFISATETIRKMSSNFDKMEEELHLLSANMDNITTCSEDISNNLKTRRQDLSKLSDTHAVLKKLQFLFELAPRMQKSIEDNAINEAVKCFLKAEKALEQYRHFPSIKVIDEECHAIVVQLKSKLHEQFSSSDATQQQLAESIQLLLQLQETPHVLAGDFLAFSGKRLANNLSELDYQMDLYRRSLSKSESQQDEVPIDVLEFVDIACSGFLTNFSSLLVSFDDLFLSNTLNAERVANERDLLTDQLDDFVNQHVGIFIEKIKARIDLERTVYSENTILVRALDRFYRRLQNLRKVYPRGDFSKRSLQIVKEASCNQCAYALEYLKSRFAEEMTRTRLVIANTGQELYASGAAIKEKLSMSELLITIETAFSEHIKTAVSNLMAFTRPEVTFLRETRFDVTFVHEVRENVVVAFIRSILTTADDYQKSGMSGSASPQLLLILSKLCIDLDSSLVGFMLSFVDEQFDISDKRGLTRLDVICQEAKEMALKLINYYVRLEGQNISQMIRQSVESRDWLASVEPRSVRSVMKRVVEDITLLDVQVGELYEEGSRIERSSDSSRSRRAFGSTGLPKSASWASSNYGQHSIDNSLMSNIQKLFSEKIEIFSPVEFSRLSVVTGIIKIGLKTLVECVRLCTFSKFGLQQVQVDAYFLQMHLWRFVSDEKLVHSLLDEVLMSSVHRSLDPALMEMSVVEKICEGP